MILSKARSSAAAQVDRGPRDTKPKVPELEELLQKRDYVGAVTLLEFRRLVSVSQSTCSKSNCFLLSSLTFVRSIFSSDGELVSTTCLHFGSFSACIECP
jgi:hypothetical protein